MKIVSSSLLFAVVAIVVVSMMMMSSSSLVSARGFFYQIICSDSGCSNDCQYTLFEEDVCYDMSNGYSGFGQCIDNRQVLLQENFAFSSNCTGLSNQDTLNSGECYASGNQYVKFNCNTAGFDHKHHNSENNQQQQPPRLHHQKHSRKNPSSDVLRYSSKKL